MVQCDVDTIHLCDSRLHNRLPPCRAISQVCSHRNAQRTRKNEGRGWDKRVIVEREKQRRRQREREREHGGGGYDAKKGNTEELKERKNDRKIKYLHALQVYYTIRYTKISYDENIRCSRIKINYYTRNNSVSMALSHENRAKMVYKSLYARTKGGWLVV